MLIRIEKITSEGLDAEFELDSKDPAVAKLDTEGPVSGSFYLKKVGEQILVKGSLNAEVRLQCARCLRNFSRKVSENVEVKLRPISVMDGEGGELELAPDDLNVEFFHGDALDIGHLAAEQVALSVPMKPLCSEDCPGICHLCGTDRIKGDCGCETEVTDLRWSALADLKKRIMDSD